MVDKRISDLEATTTLEDTTVFHIRKTETNEDFKITKSNLVKQIGNSVVNGFNATSPLANILLLTPSNSGSLDQYYEGMTIKFISPINSTDLVKIKIGTLGYIDFKTTFTNPITNVVENGVLKTGKFYEAIYSNNSFIQTNIDRQYTNEYLSIGEIMFDNNTQEYFTLYTLTSATSFYKTSYYEGMSIVFTSGIINNSVENMSNGKIYIDVDGLGQKLLSDPDGDGVPFSLQPNETILGIYDGEKFIKNMFTMQEPELPVPVDPINPPPGYNITVYVGPNEPEVSNRLLQTAYNRIIKDYGHDGGGRKVLIKFRDDYTGEGLFINQNIASDDEVSFITLEGNENVIMKGTKSIFSLGGPIVFGHNKVFNLNLTGVWKMNFTSYNPNFSNQHCFINLLCPDYASGSIFIKDCVAINTNEGSQNFPFILSENSGRGFSNIDIKDSEIKNFGIFIVDNGSNISYMIPTTVLTANNLTITNTITATRSFPYFIKFVDEYIIINLILNISKPSNYESIIHARNISQNNSRISISDTNIILSEALSEHILYAFSSLTLNNCIIKYADTVDNIKGSVLIEIIGDSFINGNDYRNKNSLTVPDIVISRSKCSLKSGTLGSTQTINGGSIVNV